MATAFAAKNKWPMVNLLRRRRSTPPQPVSQPKNDLKMYRIPSRENTLTYGDGLVRLIDDVKTTGATLTMCTRELRRIGASRVCVAVASVGE